MMKAERELFEEWWISAGRAIRIDSAWKGWQARSALDKPAEQAPSAIEYDGCNYVNNHAKFSPLHIIQAIREIDRRIRDLEDR